MNGVMESQKRKKRIVSKLPRKAVAEWDLKGKIILGLLEKNQYICKLSQKSFWELCSPTNIQDGWFVGWLCYSTSNLAGYLMSNPVCLYIYHHHHVVPPARISLTLSPLLPIVHCLWQVFRATSRILTELLYVCSSWLSCFCLAICGGP